MWPGGGRLRAAVGAAACWLHRIRRHPGGRWLVCTRGRVGMVRQMAEPAGMSSRQRWTLALVCTAAFMLLLDITVVSVALPSIQRELRASLPDLQWVSAAYALVLAVLLLPAATLGDRLGRRRLFLAGLVIFTAGSLACGLAPTALALELFRALQGRSEERRV